MPTLITTASGTFNVYYEAENRQKRIEWVSGTATVNELYTALQELFDDLTQLDDGTPISAQTPTEYTIGIIDTGDDDPWFIDRVTVEYLTGGALTTSSWTRVVGSNTGIVKIDYTETVALVPSDIGKTIKMTTDLDEGTILDYNSSTNEIWIRPKDDTAANSFDDSPTADGAWTVLTGTGTGAQANGTSLTGESLWANIFTLGTIETNTHMYVEQEGALLTKYKDSTVDWWADGQIDILVNVLEVDDEVDEYYIKVFARQHSKTYAFFEVELVNGGRNPIPLQTGDDLDNTVGYRTLTTDVESGAGWSSTDVGTVIEDNGDSDTQGIITDVSGTGPDYTIEYYLIGDPLTDFADNDVIKDPDATKTMTVFGSPANANAGLNDNAFTIVHGNTAFDVDENDTNENYSILVDCQEQTLQEVQEWLKYITRRGETGTTPTDTQAGQFYLGSDYRLSYTSLNGTVAEGDTITQEITLATGIVVAHHTTDKIIILRSSRGTFVSAASGQDGTRDVQVIPGNDTNSIVMDDGTSTAATITPVASSPFGTFAGGTFFGAPGVLLRFVISTDATNYQLIDDGGTVVNPPNKVSVTVANTREEDRIAVFRLTGAGGTINKEEYTNAAQITRLAVVEVDTSIDASVPGKATGGVLRIVDFDLEIEYRLRYASWSGTTFTLEQTSGNTADASGCTTTQITDAGGAFTTGDTARVGDLIWNQTAGDYGYIVSIDSPTVITTTVITGQTNLDVYDINSTPVALTTNDKTYVPIMDVYESDAGATDASTGTESVTVTYSADIPVRVVTRNSVNTASATTPLLPYAADATIISTGLTNNIIRSQDTIKG